MTTKTNPNLISKDGKHSFTIQSDEKAIDSLFNSMEGTFSDICIEKVTSRNVWLTFRGSNFVINRWGVLLHWTQTTNEKGESKGKFFQIGFPEFERKAECSFNFREIEESILKCIEYSGDFSLNGEYQYLFKGIKEGI